MSMNSKPTLGQRFAALVVLVVFGALSSFMVINTGWSLVPPGEQMLSQSWSLLLMAWGFAAAGIAVACVIVERRALSAWLLLSVIPPLWGVLLTLGML